MPYGISAYSSAAGNKRAEPATSSCGPLWIGLGGTTGQIKKAIIYDKAPWDILTYNSSKASLPAEEGIPISKMNGTQRNIIESLIAEYINQVPEQLAERKFKELREFGGQVWWVRREGWTLHEQRS